MKRKYTVDVDIGGTLTDGLVSFGEEARSVKVDTTPHDFTVCLFECLKEAGLRVGFEELAAFLEQVAVIRWSTTIATNVLAERKGPRIGLLLSAGHANDLYSEGSSPAFGYLISPENVVAISNPGDEEEVMASVRRLLESGVRRICVSLQGAYEDSSSEMAVRRLVSEQFGDQYLGSVPTLLGSQVCRHPDDTTRTHMALINAYVHTPLAMGLFKAEDELITLYRYRRHLYVAHINGGVARVAKTKAVDTVESGPIYGIEACSFFARRYGLDRVITLDVGGTTSKAGLLVAQRPVEVAESDLLGVPLKLPAILLRSVALGGGSVVRVQEGRLELGPESMGAYPGPACYDLGGVNATLTDAFLVAGMLDPERFLDGRRRLSREKAAESLEKHVAKPLNLGIAEAASSVIEAAAVIIERAIRVALASAGFESEGFSIFCFGGNGGNFASLVAQRMSLESAYVFKLGPVLSAFGSSLSSISHVQEEWPYLSVGDSKDRTRLSQVVEGAKQRVLRDLEGEGLEPEKARFSVEITLVDGGRAQSLRAKPEELEDALARARGPGAAVARRVAVRGVSEMPSFEPSPVVFKQPTPSPFGEREVRGQKATLFEWEQLPAGAVMTGPLVLESGTNTCSIPSGWQVTIDGFCNGVIRPAKGGP